MAEHSSQSAAQHPSHSTADPSHHGTPVYVTVWDLAPPSKWSNAAYGWFGLGIFHTNLWLPDLSVEWAFGGHAFPDTTGIFALPRDAMTPARMLDETLAKNPSVSFPLADSLPQTLDGLSLLGPTYIPPPGVSPIPDARYIGAYFVGYAGAPPSPSPDTMVATSSSLATDSTQWAALQTGSNAFKEPIQCTDPFYLKLANAILRPSVSSQTTFGVSPLFKSWLANATKSTDSRPTPYSMTTTTTTSSSSRYPVSSPASLSSNKPNAILSRQHPRYRGRRLASVSFAMRTLQTMRSDPEWHGLKYDLLSKNCNHFTHQACLKLVGTGLPRWINRTASLGKSIIWAVPKSLIDIETGITPANDHHHHHQDDDQDSLPTNTNANSKSTSLLIKPH